MKYVGLIFWVFLIIGIVILLTRPAYLEYAKVVQPAEVTMLAEVPVATKVSRHELAEAKRLSIKYAAKVEVRNWDDTRTDLLTETHAIEVDYAPKWAEAIGQSLYYAELTGKKPGILLLVQDAQKERHFVYRCQTICAKYDIDLFIEASVQAE